MTSTIRCSCYTGKVRRYGLAGMYLLSTCCVPGTVPSAGAPVVGRTEPLTLRAVSGGRRQTVNTT